MSGLGYTVRRDGRLILVTIDGVGRPHSAWAKIWGVTGPCVSARIKSGFDLAKLSAGKTANRYGATRKASASKSPNFVAAPSLDAQAVAAHWFKTPLPRAGV